MSDDSGKTKKLSLSSGKLTLGAIDPSKLRAGPAVGAGRKTVQVEVRRKRAPACAGEAVPHLNRVFASGNTSREREGCGIAARARGRHERIRCRHCR